MWSQTFEPLQTKYTVSSSICLTLQAIQRVRKTEKCSEDKDRGLLELMGHKEPFRLVVVLPSCPLRHTYPHLPCVTPLSLLPLILHGF